MTTLWLTRIVPDLRSRDARRDLGNAVGMHHRLMKLFPSIEGNQARHDLGVLYRTEDGPTGSHILLQSRHQPDLTALPARYCAQNAVARPLSPLMEALRAGLPIRYRIAANAVRKPGKTTRELYKLNAIVPLTGAAAEEWWFRQAQQAGLKVTTAHSAALDVAHGTRTEHTGDTVTTQQIRHARTRFDGTAIIEDPELLRRGITEGIGRGKAYGCGLLSIAPARGPV